MSGTVASLTVTAFSPPILSVFHVISQTHT